ncbi:S1/P1 nuclease [Bradyrhizobium nanningense]|uniref:S1/P1 nuclease n=1 Tax=Bradyrhizobium nanningense TaxID=1325118 RepID=UPI0010088F3D|nr:S1/P1 nuclease [Bradyrhizobium nanningense]
MASTWSPLAWGQLGHSLVAELAQRHLEAKLQELNGDTPLEAISNWADTGGKEHFPVALRRYRVERATYDAAIDRKELNARLAASSGSAGIIGVSMDQSRSKERSVARLKTGVHLTDDLEQPLPASERNDDQGDTARRHLAREAPGGTMSRTLHGDPLP